MAKKLIISALVMAIGLGGWLVYYFSDAQVIRRQLVGLAAVLGKEGPETAVQMALKLARVKEMLPGRCLVVIPERGYREDLERDLLLQYLIYHRSRYGVISVVFSDMSIAIPAKGQATVGATVHLQRQQIKEAEVAAVVVEPVQLVLHKAEQKWLLTEATVAEGLVQ